MGRHCSRMRRWIESQLRALQEYPIPPKNIADALNAASPPPLPRKCNLLTDDGNVIEMELTELKPYELPRSLEALMDKLGVQTDQDKTKTASAQKTCPVCGSELVPDSNVPQCPNCGTKPFEAPKEE